MHLVGATNALRGSLGQSQVADLASTNKLGHGANGFFNGDVGIDAMLIIQVNHFDTQALEAGIAGGAHVGSAAINAADSGIRFAAQDSEFGGQKNFVAHSANGLGDQQLVVAVAIDIRGIEKSDSQFD